MGTLKNKPPLVKFIASTQELSVQFSFLILYAKISK